MRFFEKRRLKAVLEARHTNLSNWSHIITISAFILLPSCTNLEAVRDISTELTMASASWDMVAKDTYETCRRQQSLNPGVNCDDSKTASEKLIGFNKILDNYFKALSAAASESSFTAEPGLEALGASIADIPGINENRVEATDRLVTVLVGLGTSALREKTLTRLIETGGPSAQELIKGLQEVTSQNLEENLKSEKGQLVTTYRAWMDRESVKIPPDFKDICLEELPKNPHEATSGPGFLVIADYCRNLSDLNPKENALENYQTSLTKAEEALDRLKSSATDLDAAELVSALRGIGSDLNSNIDAVREAFE